MAKALEFKGKIQERKAQEGKRVKKEVLTQEKKTTKLKKQLAEDRGSCTYHRHRPCYDTQNGSREHR